VELVYQDLTRAKRHDTGREGLTAEQVLRCAVLKQYRELSYEELAQTPFQATPQISDS
jgi:IS5 family transposase